MKTTTEQDLIDAAAESFLDFGISPARFTAREWRTVSRAQRRWRRRALAATGAVVLAEVAGVLAWNSWARALSTKYPQTPAPEAS